MILTLPAIFMVILKYSSLTLTNVKNIFNLWSHRTFLLQRTHKLASIWPMILFLGHIKL